MQSLLYLWQSESESGMLWERTLLVGSFALLTQATQCIINCVHVTYSQMYFKSGDHTISYNALQQYLTE